MTQQLKIQMDSVPKIKFSSVDKTPENKKIANKVIRDKLNESIKYNENVKEFFDTSIVWDKIKGVNSMPTQMAIVNSLNFKDITHKQLICKNITVCDVIPKTYDSENIDDLVIRAMLKRLSYETKAYGTHYFLEKTFYDYLEIKSVVKKTYKTTMFNIKYFIATIKLNNMLIETFYD